MYKWFLYQITLAYGCVRSKIFPQSWPAYTKISDTLYLGRLPMKNSGDDATLKNEGIDTVLSVVEKFENRTKSLAGTPVHPEDWMALGITHYQIETQDFKPLSRQAFEEAMAYIKSGKKVYVHCKAGRGRSAAVVVAYLVQNCPEFSGSVEKAIAFVQALRPHITLDCDKVESIKAFLLVK